MTVYSPEVLSECLHSIHDWRIWNFLVRKGRENDNWMGVMIGCLYMCYAGGTKPRPCTASFTPHIKISGTHDTMTLYF
jgi:hypothetical protein